MLKVGDFAKVKPGIELHSGEIANDWAGEILEIYPGHDTCLIALDAQTLNALSDEYVQECAEEGEDAAEYVFFLDDLEPSTRRDTDRERDLALERLSDRMEEFEFDEDSIENIEARNEAWIQEFLTSDFFDKNGEVDQGDAEFTAETFMRYGLDYIYAPPTEWTSSDVKEICLQFIPRKVSADEEFFQRYGDLLIPFLKFLGARGYVPHANEWIKTVEKIKHRIPIEASNPENWGMAKSMVMGVEAMGLDPTNREDLDKFMMMQQAQALAKLEQEQSAKKRITGTPAQPDPYRNIGRNDRITVKYRDGRVVDNIKFKKVESDLRNGKCELVSG